MSFLNEEEISKIGLKSYGSNLKISTKACFYQPEQISLGNNIRIDDFCILSGNIILHNNIHIAVYSYLLSSNKSLIELQDFSGMSFKTTIMTNSDDFSGEFMTNPTVPNELRKMSHNSVTVEKHGLVGAHSLVLPGANIAEGTAIGAMSLVTKPTLPWSIYFGQPAKRLKARKQTILELEKKYYDMLKG